MWSIILAAGAIGAFLGFIGGLLSGRAFAQPSRREERMLEELNNIRAVAMATAAASGVRREHITGMKHTQQMFADAGVGRDTKTRSLERDGSTEFTDIPEIRSKR